jgi:hypothetical protein
VPRKKKDSAHSVLPFFSLSTPWIVHVRHEFHDCKGQSFLLSLCWRVASYEACSLAVTEPKKKGYSQQKNRIVPYKKRERTESEGRRE